MSLDTPAEGSMRTNGNVLEQYKHGEWVETPIPRSIFKMTPEQRKTVMDNNPADITFIHQANVYFDWSWMGCGFGQLSVIYDPENGRIRFMDEHMGKERTRQLMHAFVDHLVDNGEFDEVENEHGNLPASSHCQNGGDVCLAGNQDGVCCPEDSCDIDDGVRKPR